VCPQVLRDFNIVRGSASPAVADLTETIAAYSQALFEQFPRIPDHELLVVATLSWNLPIYRGGTQRCWEDDHHRGWTRARVVSRL